MSTDDLVLGHYVVTIVISGKLSERQEVTAPNIVESILKVSHVSCTQHAQQVQMS